MENTDNQQSYFDVLSDPNLSEREKYKYYIQNNQFALDLKEKIKKVVAERGLGALMNDTKWIKLQSSISKLPFPPPYIEKLVLENKTFAEVKISDIPQWMGDWSPHYEEGMSLFFTIEYIKVRPRYGEYIGNLVAPKIIDETQEFVLLLNQLHISYEEDNGTFTIYGYK